jgi:hypothetical protein
VPAARLALVLTHMQYVHRPWLLYTPLNAQSGFLTPREKQHVTVAPKHSRHPLQPQAPDHQHDLRPPVPMTKQLSPTCNTTWNAQQQATTCSFGAQQGVPQDHNAGRQGHQAL